MTQMGRWIGQLETEIARELGQTVTLRAGGEAPEKERTLRDALEIPGARLALAVDGDDLAAVLAAGRVIEAGQADAGMLRELWTGILASVAARLGGRMTAPGQAAGQAEENAAPCTLQLGEASMRMALAVEPAAAGAEPAGNASRAGAPAARALPNGNYDLLLQVELDASVRFGTREMELKELLELGPGDVVELDRHVADPVDLIVGDKIVARGEVVLVNGNFGLRVTEVAEPVRRLESIRCSF